MQIVSSINCNHSDLLQMISHWCQSSWSLVKTHLSPDKGKVLLHSLYLTFNLNAYELTEQRICKSNLGECSATKTIKQQLKKILSSRNICNTMQISYLTSGVDKMEVLTEEVGLLNFVIDCVTGKGKYGTSDSRPVWTVDDNKVLGNELVYSGCK